MEASQSRQPVHYIVFLSLPRGQSSLRPKGSHFVVLPACPGSRTLSKLPSRPSCEAAWQSKQAAQWVRVQCFFCSQTRHSTYSLRTVSKQTTQCRSKQLETGSEGGQRGSQSTVGDPKCTTKTSKPQYRSPKCPRSALSLVAGVVASAAADDDHGLKVNVKSGHQDPG